MLPNIIIIIIIVIIVVIIIIIIIIISSPSFGPSNAITQVYESVPACKYHAGTVRQ